MALETADYVEFNYIAINIGKSSVETTVLGTDYGVFKTLSSEVITNSGGDIINQQISTYIKNELPKSIQDNISLDAIIERETEEAKFDCQSLIYDSEGNFIAEIEITRSN